MHRIVDLPEHHAAPGAWAWDSPERVRRDGLASRAAQRFLERAADDEDCWRCEASAAEHAVGLCSACLDDLREP